MYIKLLLIIMIFFNIFYINCEDTKHITLRNYPSSLDIDDVKSMLKKYDFVSQDCDWNKDFCNPNGRGFNNNFVLQKNGMVVYDRASGLMWQQGGSDEFMDFEDAKKWIDELNKKGKKGYAGFHDWRLPTLDEAMSLMEPEEKNGLYIDPIFEIMQEWIWTSDLEKDESAAWVVYFYSGECGPRDFVSSYVRAVRSGQSSKE